MTHKSNIKRKQMRTKKINKTKRKAELKTKYTIRKRNENSPGKGNCKQLANK
jgi:hypothetical protein